MFRSHCAGAPIVNCQPKISVLHLGEHPSQRPDCCYCCCYYFWGVLCKSLIINGGVDEGNRTLIGLPKLFIGGKVSAAQGSPQPTVNNFAVAAKMIFEKLPFRQKNGEHAWPGRRMSNPKRLRLRREFRSGPSALTQRNTPEPFA